MQNSPWFEYVPEKGMNVTNLSRCIRDAIDSFNQGVVFRKTTYRFNEASIKKYLCVVCKNEDNRRKIVKPSGALSRTFVKTLESDNMDRFSFIANAINGEPDIEKLIDKLNKKIKPPAIGGMRI